MRLFKFLHFNKACPAKPWRSRGFTFIEMVMVITIFTIISGVALFNFGDYSDSISLQNLAHQISLEIVQAQRDAISGRNAPQFDPDRPSYGVAFSSSPSCVQDFPCESKFIRFADIDNNGKY